MLGAILEDIIVVIGVNRSLAKTIIIVNLILEIKNIK